MFILELLEGDCSEQPLKLFCIREEQVTQYLVNLALCCQGGFSGPSCPDPECMIPGLRNELELWLNVSCYLYGWGRI